MKLAVNIMFHYESNKQHNQVICKEK